MADAQTCTSLVLQGPEFSYVFGHDDIQQYPDSFIANLVRDWASSDSNAGATAAGSTEFASQEGSPAGKLRVLQLSGMPESPLTLWPWAAAVAHSIYRYQHITADVLSTLLQGITGKTYQHFTQPYERLTKLISYLNLPGQVGDYMPPLHNISLGQSHVLALCFNIIDLELDHKAKRLAEEAVAKILYYKPFGDDDRHGQASSIHMVHGNRFAMFAIAVDEQQRLDVPLKVYAVDQARRVSGSLQKQVAEYIQAAGYPNFHESSEDAIEHVEVLAKGQCGVTTQITTRLNTTSFIGKRHSVSRLVDHVRDAFTKSMIGTPLSMHENCVRYQQKCNPDNPWVVTHEVELPCWVLIW